MTDFQRRDALKIIGASAAAVSATSSGNANASASHSSQNKTRVDHWHLTHDRVWLGGNFWANPMEDWAIVDGAAECQTKGGDRNVHLLTHQITNTKGSFEMSVQSARLEAGNQDGGAGFKIGIKSELNEYRSNLFAKSGLKAGLANGKLMIGKKTKQLAGPVTLEGFTLRLTGKPSGKNYELELSLLSENSESGDGPTKIDSVKQTVSPEMILGNVAVASNLTLPVNNKKGSRYRFHNWNVSGDAFTITESQMFGPILWSMYSLSDSRSDEGFVMKISALTGPLGEKDRKDVELHIKNGDSWKSLGTAELDTDAWLATFRIPKWNEKLVTPFKLVYKEKHTDGSETASEWTGTIKANPSGRPLRLGALTCQNDYGFPYAPVADNIVKLDPDLIYFSGDQLYEGHGGYGLIRDPAGPAILNYLRKFYQHGLAFREAMRDRPTLCIPDDHDVFQGNYWGEGGAKMDPTGGTSSKGGYREPVRMVNVVHKTNAGHHPDYYDTTPIKQGMTVYYGDMVYGDVSFAILGDRQFKSGPERVDTGSGRADHVLDKDFDTSVLNKPGLVFLGERQEKFLEAWADDWRNHSMKVLLSQTVFAGVATHHGGFNGYLKADLDSGGWPQDGRDKAISIIRKSKALHINGDQHLATLSQYGVETQRDSNWSFCTPAISAGYPRWWRPDDIGMPHENRPKHGLANTGEFLDGLGNKVFVYAVGNPVVGKDKNRYKKAHEKGSGFGLITIDTKAKTYHLEAFRFLIDPTDGNPDNQFPGWPVTIHQDENMGQNRIE